MEHMAKWDFSWDLSCMKQGKESVGKPAKNFKLAENKLKEMTIYGIIKEYVQTILAGNWLGYSDNGLDDNRGLLQWGGHP